MSAILQRETFEVSRLMEFFTEHELTRQMGFGRDRWPGALLKELVDNALDAAESIGVAPEIIVTLQPDALIVQDNGPGLPLEVIERSLDYGVRVSDKTGYVSPTRGQQGNALKCLWAAPFVATSTGEGRIGIETAGTWYEVRVSLDRIAQEPRLTLECLGDTAVKNGTRITLHWPEIAGYLTAPGMASFYGVTTAFAALNPHATITVTEGEDSDQWTASDPTWPHWCPDRPTSPHWYTRDRLRNLMALLLDADRRAGGRSRTVTEFIHQFSGLSGTQKAATVAKAAGLHGAMLSDLIDGDDLAPGKVGALLFAMRQEAKPVKPEVLGVIGEDHCRQTLEELGSEPDSITYRRVKGTAHGLPYVVEVAFGMRPEDYNCTIFHGVNFSLALEPPFIEVFQSLSEAQVQVDDPVIMIVHLTCPRVEYTNHGKTQARLPTDIGVALSRLVKSATKPFTEAKRRADRAGRLRENDRQALLKAEKAKELTAKDAAWQVMERAYPAAARYGGTNAVIPQDAAPQAVELRHAQDRIAVLEDKTADMRAQLKAAQRRELWLQG